MATTTKKSSRTKTSKAKTSKATNKSTQRVSAARTASAKTTKKAVKKPSNKTVEVMPLSSSRKTAKSKSSWRTATVSRLRSLNLMAAGLFVLLAVAAGALMNNTTQQLTISHLTSDVLTSSQSTVFAPAVKVLYDFEIRWVVVGIMSLSAVLPLLYITNLEKSYQSYVKT